MGRATGIGVAVARWSEVRAWAKATARAHVIAAHGACRLRAVRAGRLSPRPLRLAWQMALAEQPLRMPSPPRSLEHPRPSFAR